MISSYSHGTSLVPLLGETVGENLRRTVERFGARDALIVRSQRVRWTYGELYDRVRLAARGLMAHGVQKGDRVGIWAPNRSEWVVLQYASAMAGAVLVNINPAYKTTELEYALRQSSVSLLVLARQFRQSDFAAMVKENTVLFTEQAEIAEITLVPDLDMAGARGSAIAAAAWVKKQ